MVHMAAPLNTTTQEPQLLHLTVFNGIYAETEHGRFYAIRSDLRHMWHLVSRDHEFPPSPRRSVLDSRTGLTTAREIAQIGFTTACYLDGRGVEITLDGEPFQPGRLSLHRALRLIEDRGLLEDHR